MFANMGPHATLLFGFVLRIVREAELEAPICYVILHNRTVLQTAGSPLSWESGIVGTVQKT